MTSRTLSLVADTLRVELKKLVDQRDTALRTVDHMEQEIRRVETAISVLIGEKVPKKKGPKKGLNGVEVTALVERVLHQEGPLTQPKLRERVLLV